MYEHLEEIEKDFSSLHSNSEGEDPKSKKIYIYNVFLYLGYMILPIFIVSLISLLFSNNTFFYEPANPSQSAIYLAANDVNSFLVIRKGMIDDVDDVYKGFLVDIYEDGDFIIYAHDSASFYVEGSYFTITNIDDQTIINLKEDVLSDILNGITTVWSNNAKINFYIPVDDKAPFIAATAIDISSNLVPQSKLPTMALLSLYRFSIMLIIAIPMVIISKPIIKNDYLILKNQNSNDNLYTSLLSKAGTGILYVLAGNLAIGLVNSLLSKILQVPEQISANQLAINLMLKSPYFIFMLLSAVILGPIVEELVFRKSFFGLIKNKNWALVTSSLVFGLIHVTTELLTGDIRVAIVSGLPYIGAGFIFGYIYLKNEKNILIPILAHMGYNLVSVLISLFLT
ncbi:CPBP family intramembrane glutamic endopeptidase [Acholeplasma granularum]|uniref:CPBP family intramembrane glutamic endopeptidase n=1 Tax=Acholeplasma granularum TaxID=264635 RepID=UPI000471DC58|nr:CPBP family intramembrane glutamic endopeptidase [Acholeplasma granularum]